MFLLFCLSPEFLPVCTGIVGATAKKRSKKGPPGPIYNAPPGRSFVQQLYYCSFRIGTLLHTSNYKTFILHFQ